MKEKLMAEDLKLDLPANLFVESCVAEGEGPFNVLLDREIVRGVVINL